MKPDNPDTLLTRSQAADALTAAGYPIKTATLEAKASRGGGPAYRLFGRRAIYRKGDVFDWAEARTSAPVSSSSEMEAA